ncbi:glycosyltransferase family 2 protein [Shewanella sp. MF08487]|uniref:glycosyltransferase family 2 protein n=1 Tax=Shewanella TaxID=22 RepID=UPI003D7B3C40
MSNLDKIISCSVVDKIIYVDNSDSNQNFFIEECSKVKYINLNENLGIATAQNVGLEVSILNDNSNAVVLFDQDSILDSLLLESLYRDFSVLIDLAGSELAAMGPTIIDSFSGKVNFSLAGYMKNINYHSCYEVKREIIASGKVINKIALLEVGLMEEELFIDGVDHEWCWRAISKGYKIYVSKNSSMVHTVGDARKKIGPLTLRVSSPIRMYYQFRNYFSLSPRQYVPFYWKLRNFVGYGIKFIVFGFLVKDSEERRQYMLKGLKHGISKKVGKYRSS